MSTHYEQSERHRSVIATLKIEQLEVEVQQLQVALVSRASIDQAIGVLMLHFGIDAQTAFQVLVRWSSHTNTKLVTLALEVTDAAGHGGAAVAAVVLDMARRSQPERPVDDARPGQKEVVGDNHAGAVSDQHIDAHEPQVPTALA